MLRRLRDVLVFDLAVLYGHHLAVAGIRYLMSRDSLGSPERCAEALTVVLPPRRPDCVT